MHTTPFVEFCFRSQEGRFNSLYPCGRICASVDWPSLVQITACRLVGTKPLPQPMLAYCRLHSWEQISVKFESELYNFYSRKFKKIRRLPKWWPSLYDKVPWWIMQLYNPSGIYRNPNWTVSITRLRLGINQTKFCCTRERITRCSVGKHEVVIIAREPISGLFRV